MAIWPIWMAAYIALIGLAIMAGPKAWHAPAAMLLGYILMRPVMYFLEPTLQPLGAGFVWLSVAFLLGKLGHFNVALLVAACGISYPALLPFGQFIEWPSLSVIVSEIFAVLALIATGGGIIGLAKNHNSPNDNHHSRVLPVLSPNEMALGQGADRMEATGE